METHRVIGKGIVPKRADDDKEAIRTAIVRNVVKNYLWNSVSEEAIQNTK
ncbi:unnamed protein product [Anisakis simplex]|uniref:Transposase n=1 Tax=Anisakis simplex TaxID=6269 RepID=A0A0M3JN83_ANISI|nr:unnamed protein product [Anisakis simplex]